MAYPLATNDRSEAHKAYEDAKREVDEKYLAFKDARDRAKADGVDLVNDSKAFAEIKSLNDAAKEAGAKAKRALALYEDELDRAASGKAMGLGAKDLAPVTSRFLKGIDGGRITGASLKGLDATSGASPLVRSFRKGTARDLRKREGPKAVN